MGGRLAAAATCCCDVPGSELADGVSDVEAHELVDEQRRRRLAAFGQQLADYAQTDEARLVA